MYLGLVQLNNTLTGVHLTKNTSGTPQDSASAPTYRIYGTGTGPMTSGTGSLSQRDSGPSGGGITAATNASPIVITSTAHGLSTGTRVTISGALGNTAANGDWQITVVDANTFSLNSSTGNGTYTSGGTWHVTGAWAISIAALGANGYASGQNYAMLVTATVGGTVMAELHTFTVV